jgi:RecB family exonuclease
MKSKSEILSRIELRQSTLKDWLFCPRMFHLKHIEGIAPNWRNPAALHGTVLHRIIELMHEGHWDLNFDFVYSEIFRLVENETDTPVFWKTDREHELEKLKANALEMIEGYKANYANRECRVILGEAKFRVKVAGYWFTGTIDQLRENADGTIELIDFKTNKQRPTLAFLQNDWQLNLYSYALKYGIVEYKGTYQKLNLLPTYSSWYFLRSHEIRKRKTVNGDVGEQKSEPLIRTQKGIDDLRAFRKDLENMLKVMLKDWVFPNTISCGMCGYVNSCMNRQELKPEILTEAKALLEAV